MIRFEVRYDEATAKWQGRTASGWTEPMRPGKLLDWLQREVTEVAPLDPEKRWSQPLAHLPRSTEAKPVSPATGRRASPPRSETQGEWEIRGGKVQRIAATPAERQAQQVDELLSVLEGLND